jgi:hypothetical protein
VTTTRKLLLTAMLGAALVAVGGGPAGAGSLPYAPKDCTKPRIEPHSIVLSCSDAGLFVKHIEWDEWSADRAEGDGTLIANTCRPTCEAGNFKRYPAEIELKKVRTRNCGGTEVPLFRKAVLDFRRDRPDFPGIRKSRLECVPSGDGL